MSSPTITRTPAHLTVAGVLRSVVPRGDQVPDEGGAGMSFGTQAVRLWIVRHVPSRVPCGVSTTHASPTATSWHAVYASGGGPCG